MVLVLDYHDWSKLTEKIYISKTIIFSHLLMRLKCMDLLVIKKSKYYQPLERRIST